jgi:hypothetical protein
MLQINSGKLFTREVGRINHLRGVLYSNLELRYGYDVVTAAGTLRQTDGPRGSRAIVFEIDERIEASEDGREFLISHTIAPYLADFSALASFGLRASVSPDAGLVERLASPEPGLASYHPPRQFVRRYFDDDIPLQQADIAPFAELTDQLLALERRQFLGAMRAIRTFVAGLHRMRDDLGLAYALLVSAVESLAQDFDRHQTRWEDVDERKRRPIDAALKRVSRATADNVREAIRNSEHSSLARRYRAFVLSHVDGDYFREPNLVAGGAIARHELDEGLRQAYALRSRYVHNLRPLPDAISLAESVNEVTRVDRRPALTFEGLVRLTRHVIMRFIMTGRTVEREPYPYTRELSGVILAPLAPEMWVGLPLTRADQAKHRLEGHLEQLVQAITSTGQTTVTDLEPIFPEMERFAKTNKANRTALLTLYALFAHTFLKPEQRPAGLEALLNKHMHEIGSPSNEALVARTIFGSLDQWPIDAHQKSLDRYFLQRSTPGGLHAPRLFDAMLSLALAERYRQLKRHAEAKRCLARAAESFPGHHILQDLEASYSPRRRIQWREALLPVFASRKRDRRGKPEPPTG